MLLHSLSIDRLATTDHVAPPRARIPTPPPDQEITRELTPELDVTGKSMSFNTIYDIALTKRLQITGCSRQRCRMWSNPDLSRSTLGEYRCRPILSCPNLAAVRPGLYRLLDARSFPLKTRSWFQCFADTVGKKSPLPRSISSRGNRWCQGQF